MAVNAPREFRASNTMSGGAGVADSHRKRGRLYRELADLLISEGRISEAQSVLNMGTEEEVFQFWHRDATAELAFQALMVQVDAGNATAVDEEQVFLLQDALLAATGDFDAAVADFLTAASPDGHAATGGCGQRDASVSDPAGAGPARAGRDPKDRSGADGV